MLIFFTFLGACVKYLTKGLNVSISRETKRGIGDYGLFLPVVRTAWKLWWRFELFRFVLRHWRRFRRRHHRRRFRRLRALLIFLALQIPPLNLAKARWALVAYVSTLPGEVLEIVRG
ncbi:hypothetical protein C0J52_07887 [Blattella germanica]|nr:hypothetical protein C0J52_07887 [Blattella germanica]